jgi:hypothetical protein
MAAGLNLNSHNLAEIFKSTNRDKDLIASFTNLLTVTGPYSIAENARHVRSVPASYPIVFPTDVVTLAEMDPERLAVMAWPVYTC